MCENLLRSVIVQQLKLTRQLFARGVTVASARLITMGRLLDLKLLKYSLFLVFLNINSVLYSFKTVANQNSVKYSDYSWNFKKYSDSNVNRAFNGLPEYAERIFHEVKAGVLH